MSGFIEILCVKVLNAVLGGQETQIKVNSPLTFQHNAMHVNVQTNTGWAKGGLQLHGDILLS